MAAPHAPAFVMRLWIFGPLLYAGLFMAVNPAGFESFLDGLVSAMRNFEERLHGFPVGERRHLPGAAAFSPGVRKGIRWAGAVLALWAFLALAGIPG
jgi:hypothetical protein